MIVTLEGTYGTEWAFDLDDLLAAKAMKVRSQDGTETRAIRIYLKFLSQTQHYGKHAEAVWLLDTPANREVLGMKPYQPQDPNPRTPTP